MTSGDGGTEFARLGKTPAEQAAALVRPFSVLVWAATEIMHWAGMQGWQDLAIATAIAAPLAWGAAARGWVPSALPAWIALAGGWTAAAWYLGPLAWLPAPMLTVVWIILLWAAHRAAHEHPAVVNARRWRDARARWLMIRNDWGLGGTHLLDYQETYLGELYEVSTKGTGKRASQFIGSRAQEEYIAEHENLPRGRVQIRGHELAGRILISIRRRDPWEGVLLHPLACEKHETVLPERRSILSPAMVGQDPETGEQLTIPLCDENGAKRVSITANSGGGKGVLEDNLFEHVTACDDALAVHLNLSVKGHEDEECWGPACWLTAYGPARKSRAAAVLKVIAAVIEWRTANFKRGRYVPSPEHPAIIIFNDESDSALSALREEISTIVTKGRSHGVGYVHLGQRNTREYVNPKDRSQDNVRCTGLVQNQNEARHAGSLAGPDMSTYGEGKPGVWKVELLGAGISLGRTWMFGRTAAAHAEFAEELAAERAFSRPVIGGACREYLGDSYETLLASEVFTRWAQDCTPDEAVSRDDDWPQDTPAPARPAGDETRSAVALPAAATAVADPDLEEMLRTPMDDDARTRYASVRERLSAAAESLAETAAMPRPETDPADRAAFIAQRWQQVTQNVQIPEGARPRLLEMLAEGTTTTAVAAAFLAEYGTTRWKGRLWLEAIRDEGLAVVSGNKRGARWRLVTPPLEDDGQ